MGTRGGPGHSPEGRDQALDCPPRWALSWRVGGSRLHAHRVLLDTVPVAFQVPGQRVRPHLCCVESCFLPRGMGDRAGVRRTLPGAVLTPRGWAGWRPPGWREVLRGVFRGHVWASFSAERWGRGESPREVPRWESPGSTRGMAVVCRVWGRGGSVRCPPAVTATERLSQPRDSFLPAQKEGHLSLMGL